MKLELRGLAGATLAIAVALGSSSATAEIVGASFSALVVVVYDNPSGITVETGDVLRGHLVIDTSQTTRMNPTGIWADYNVDGGAQMSVYIAGREFRRPVDFINVTNDRSIATSDTQFYGDRFFVSGGDVRTNPSTDSGMQLWLDQLLIDQIPTLVSSVSIPVPLSLDWQVATSTAWLTFEPEIRVAGWLTSFEAFDTPVMFRQLLVDAEGAGLNKGTTRKIAVAQTYYVAGDVPACRAMLEGFVNDVRKRMSQKRPKLEADLGSRLIGDAEALRSAVEFM